MTTEELRKKLGLKPNQLLTNSAGMTADLLGISTNGEAILGVLDTGRVVHVPTHNLFSKEPSAKEKKKIKP